MILEACRPDDERAESCYRRAHARERQSFKWAYYLAMVLAARTKYDEAIATLRQALELDPEYLPARLKIGEYLATEGRTDDARKVYEDILRRHPESAQAHYALGQVYEAARDVRSEERRVGKECGDRRG